ncbi:MAG: hypothetical protein AAGA30_04255 [Planctomycetota bacterium]
MSRHLVGNWEIESVEINLASAVKVDGFNQLQIGTDGTEILPNQIDFEILDRDEGRLDLRSGELDYTAEIVCNRSHLRMRFYRADTQDEIYLNATKAATGNF